MRLAARTLAVVVLGPLAWGSVARGQAPSAEPPQIDHDRVVPVHEEPRHRQVFQSGTTRILELQVRPGDTSLFHSHNDPVLYVNISSGAMRTQELGKEWSAPPQGRGGARGGGAGAPGGATAAAPSAPAAASIATAPAAPAAPTTVVGGRPPVRVASTTSYVERPVTHRITNVGTTMVHALVVVNQTAGNAATTEREAGFDGTPELTNPWYRAYRFTLAPGQSASHRHATPAFLAQTVEGTATARGARLWALNGPAAWAFFEPGDAHVVRNTGATPVEFLEIEVRQPAR